MDRSLNMGRTCQRRIERNGSTPYHRQSYLRRNAIAACALQWSGSDFYETRQVQFNQLGILILGQRLFLSLKLVYIRHNESGARLGLKLPSLDVCHRRIRQERTATRFDLGIDHSAFFHGDLDFDGAADLGITRQRWVEWKVCAD